MKKKLLLWQGRGSAPVTSISVIFACQEPDRSAQVRSTGITEEEPSLTRLQCRCSELCALTASEIDRRPELVGQIFADTAHPMEVKLRACEACSMTDSDGESEGISDEESVHSDDFSGAPDQLCGGWGFSRGRASGSSTEATSEDLDDALGLAKPEMSPDASSCQAPWRPARKIAGVRKSLRENSKGLSVSSDFLSDVRAWSGEPEKTKWVDAFAAGRRPMPGPRVKSWGRQQDAFEQCWGTDMMFLCPPQHCYKRTVDKIPLDGARGVILVPVKREEAWFWALGELSFGLVGYST